MLSPLTEVSLSEDDLSFMKLMISKKDGKLEATRERGQISAKGGLIGSTQSVQTAGDSTAPFFKTPSLPSHPNGQQNHSSSSLNSEYVSSQSTCSPVEHSGVATSTNFITPTSTLSGSSSVNFGKTRTCPMKRNIE